MLRRLARKKTSPTEPASGTELISESMPTWRNWLLTQSTGVQHLSTNLQQVH
jgi:hypothetical protein